MINLKNIIMVLKDEYEYGKKLNGVLKELAYVIILIEITLSLLFMIARPNYLTFTTFFDGEVIIYIAIMLSSIGIEFTTVFSTTFPETCPRIIKFKKYKDIEVIIGILITCMSKFIICMLPIFIIIYMSTQYYSANLGLIYLIPFFLSNSFFNISLDIYAISIFKNYKFYICTILKVNLFILNLFISQFIGRVFCYNREGFSSILYPVFLQSIFSLILIFKSARSNGKIVECYENNNNFCTIRENNNTLTFYCKNFVNFIFRLFIMTILVSINFTIYGFVFLGDLFITHECVQKSYIFQYLLIFALAILSFALAILSIKIYIFITRRAWR